MEINVKKLRSATAACPCKDAGYFPVAATTDGRHVLIVHRAGDGHIGVKGRLDCIISEDAGRTWSRPLVVVDGPYDDRNPSVGVTKSGIIVVAYWVIKNYGEDGQWFEAVPPGEAWLTRSHDGGRTWEKPYPLNIGDYRELSPYGQMLTLDDGSLLMPIYGAIGWQPGTERKDCSYLVRSTDEGLTWEKFTMAGEYVNESAFLLLPEGRLLAVMRGVEYDCRDALSQSFADIHELKWSPLEAIGSGGMIPPSLARLSSGGVLLAFGYRGVPYGARGGMSRDGGRTWRKDRVIVFGDDGDNADCGYPSALLLEGGRLLVAYYTTRGFDAYSCKGARLHVVTCDEDELARAFWA